MFTRDYKVNTFFSTLNTSFINKQKGNVNVAAEAAPKDEVNHLQLLYLLIYIS